MNGAVPLSEVRWQATPAEDLVWVQWGPDYALFHRASGQTHFVNAATAFLLREVLTRPASLADITDALSAHPGQVAPEFATQIDDLLARFEILGLVSRVPP